MKKIIAIILFIVVLFTVYNKVFASNIETDNSLIRLRVIPNSNSVEDQSMKELVKSYLEKDFYPLINEEDTQNEIREKIINNLDKMDNDIHTIFKTNNYDKKFTISYGYNFFPQKEQYNETFQEGYYESLVISIGSAEGDNFWCMLFPNFCMLEGNNKEEVKYDFILSKILSKFMN